MGHTLLAESCVVYTHIDFASRMRVCLSRRLYNVLRLCDRLQFREARIYTYCHYKSHFYKKKKLTLKMESF